jgi:hypothetical protein
MTMEPTEEIPCAKCQSYNGKEKKFSCNPDNCKELSTWLFEHVIQLREESPRIQKDHEIAIRYVV